MSRKYDIPCPCRKLDDWKEEVHRHMDEVVARIRENERLREALEKAVIIGISMIDPENQPPQWSIEEAMKMLDELRR